MLYLLGYGEPPVPEFAGRTKAGGEGNSEPERDGGGRDERRHNTTHRSSCTRTTPSSTPFTTPPWPPLPPRCASGPLRVWLPPLARRMLRAARCEQGTRRSGRLRDLHGTTDADGGAAAAANHGSAQDPHGSVPPPDGVSGHKLARCMLYNYKDDDGSGEMKAFIDWALENQTRQTRSFSRLRARKERNRRLSRILTAASFRSKATTRSSPTASQPPCRSY